MRVFVTGATGFIGTKLVKELVDVGHTVRGLSRSDEGMEQLKAMGAEAQRGDLEDLDGLRRGVAGMDAVVNLAFNHDLSKFAEGADNEIKAIEVLGSALEPGKVFVVTSGVAITRGGAGYVRLESDPPLESKENPRKPEQAAWAAAKRGVRVGVVRNSQIHDSHKQGMVSLLIETARQKGVSAYVGEGEFRWAAAPVLDTAHLYRLAVEKMEPGVSVYHAVQEEGVSLKEIAETIGKRLAIPVLSVPLEKAVEHFGPFGHYAAMDILASSERTRKTLGWEPTGPGMIEDLLALQGF